MKLYSSLASWWPLLSAREDYAEEAVHHWRMLSQYSVRSIETMLELGSGGGNNAFHLKKRCRLTLSDVSPQMLEVSRAVNPECEHVQGDMRTLRLDREFDAVFVHDAVLYMRTERDLRDAMTTAFQHCKPGGVALFVVDHTRESWEPSTSHGGHDGVDRSLRYLEWNHDPVAGKTEYICEMVYLLREADGSSRVEHDRHRLGLFPTATWLKQLQEVGFRTFAEPCPYTDGENAVAFVGVRP